MKDLEWKYKEDLETGDSDDDNKVEASHNRIYFYSEVKRSKILTLNKYIRNLNINLATVAISYDTGPKDRSIYLHINSYGGSVFAGLAAVDYIKNSEIPICSIVDGCAASAATLMSVVAEERKIHANSFMLIHQLSSGMWGKFEELKDDIKNCEVLMSAIKKIYRDHTTIPKSKIDQILKRDLWFDAKTCLKYGLVDEIIV